MLAVLLLAIAFHRTAAALWRTWWNNDNYSHGVLIPPITLFLVWRLKDELRALPIAPSWLGLGLLGAGALLQVIGIRGDVTIFQGWALIAILAGLAWTWCGWRWLRLLAFPIAFLIFMVPTVPWFLNQVSFRLKVVAANGAVHLAQAMGVSVLQRGMDLYFSSGTLTVENACSGLNSLVALMALGALFAYFSQGAAWRRWALFLSAMPIAVIGNILRLTSLCVMAVFTSAHTASGHFHDVGGFVLFGIALLLLGLTKRALRC
ncbi:MAG: exosortase [Candidatus Eisenbacteria bacterium]